MKKRNVKIKKINGNWVVLDKCNSEFDNLVNCYKSKKDFNLVLKIWKNLRYKDLISIYQICSICSKIKKGEFDEV